MLERIIHGRINYHLNIDNYWSNKQYGFKQGISTEHALDNLIKTIKEDKTNNYQKLLIAMDIKGAVDNIRWPILINKLKHSPCPDYLVNWVVNFHPHRYVSLEENRIKVTKQTFGG